MRDLLGAEEFEAYVKSFEEERLYGLRVNTLKISPEEFLKITDLSLKPIPWIRNGFYYEGEERPAKNPHYFAGLYYLQEPSAMTPASLLPVMPGDKVLDLCAAPGGKSTELGAKLKGKGMLVSNDISNSRAKALLKNLELWGIENICVTSEEPAKLKEIFGQFFDKILIDAPCSGEGMFRKDADMVKSYEEHGPEYYAVIQKEIVTQAVDMLVPGGFLLYSTCTFSLCEDEDIIRGVLAEHEDMELISLPLFDGASDGMGLSGCLRLFPHRIKGEGHFMALLRKKQSLDSGEKKKDDTEKEKPLPGELVDFLSLLSKPFDTRRIYIKDETVYYLPESFPKQGKKLRYLRTGLLLGELKKGRFEPAQPLAMVLKPEEFGQTICWNKEDERVIRYLKGETISLKEEEGQRKGWCLICVDGFPLGFAKGSGSTLKNKYYPGWRWQ
ncbi:SAM-dependent methyltransferase [Lacrimispora algidixylanolytica]|uniref:SAM-dependent methyltransferase n=2 Tax=Lacrimispora algidixylanolytica TaxID=94868 RepID=A0A419STX8_9FIRM|nr:SAM-dependent methyltransferase [Lacrimispora algidixylanolytica]